MRLRQEQVFAKKQQAIDLYSGGQPAAAVRNCEELCHQSVADHDIFCLLGIISGSMGQYENSVNYCMEAIRIQPQYIDAYFNLGLALSKLGRHAEAIRALETVTTHRRDDARAHYVLGILRTTIDEHPAAIESYRAAMACTGSERK